MLYNVCGCCTMRNNKENPWTLKICDLLKKELDNNKYEVACFEKIPYSVFINSYSENNANIDIMRYEVDLLIKEKRGNYSIPKLIIESKYGEITTHDTITYSNKAKAHKDLYSGLRYGLMIGNSNELGVSPRIINHGDNFDFIFVFKSDTPSDKEWALFVDIIKRNLDISNKLENIISGKKNKDKVRYSCIEKNIEFYE